VGLGKEGGLVVMGSEGVGHGFVVDYHSTCGQTDGCVPWVVRMGVFEVNKVQ